MAPPVRDKLAARCPQRSWLLKGTWALLLLAHGFGQLWVFSQPLATASLDCSRDSKVQERIACETLGHIYLLRSNSRVKAKSVAASMPMRWITQPLTLPSVPPVPYLNFKSTWAATLLSVPLLSVAQQVTCNMEQSCTWIGRLCVPTDRAESDL